jgi:hypothetical protein
MSKPDWKDAPMGATHLAQDATGWWWWYRDEPKPVGLFWTSSRPHEQATFGSPNRNWKDTLEKRPEQ